MMLHAAFFLLISIICWLSLDEFYFLRVLQKYCFSFTETFFAENLQNVPKYECVKMA